jgi:hypothetical protein
LPDLVPGDSARIVAYALDTDSQNVPPSRIAWRSSADRVATVSATGWVKAIAPGQAEILVSADTVQRSVSVHVVPPRVADAPNATRAPSTGGRDSAGSASMPALAQGVADTLFNELAAIINARALARLTGPSGARSADAQLQRDFLTFLRDAQPLAAVQRVRIGAAGPAGVELTSAMHFTWRNHGGVPFDRIARFSGVAVYTSGGWSLRDVRLLGRFW